MTKRSALRFLAFGILGAALSVLLVFVALALAVDTGLFHDALERRLAQTAGAKVALGALYIPPYWPFRIQLGPTQIESDLGSLKFTQLEVTLSSPWPPFQVRVDLEEPVIVVKSRDASAKPTPAAPSAASPVPEWALPLGLNVFVHRGHVETDAGALQNLNLEFAQHVLLFSEATLRLAAEIQPAGVPLNLPLHLESETLTLNQSQFGAKDLRLGLSALNVTLRGTSQRDGSVHNWKLKSDVPDLSLLPEPPGEERVSHWRGALKVEGEITKTASQPLAFQVKAELKEGRAELGVSRENLRLHGPLELGFKVEASGPLASPTIEGLDLSMDLTGAELSWPHLFLKAPSTPLRLAVRARGDQKEVTLESAKLEFWKAVLSASGRVDLENPAQTKLQAALAPINISGLEKIVLALADQPVRGELSAKGQYQGPVTDFKAGHVQVDPLQLKGFEATVNYDRPGSLKARGPVRLDFKSRVDWQNGALKEIEASGKADLTAAALTLGPLRKEGKKIFQTEFNVVQSQASVQIRRAWVNTFLGKADLSGSARDFKKPKVNLQLNLHPLSLTEVRLAFPQYHDLVPAGEMTSHLHFEGQVGEVTTWWTWPLTVEGVVKVTLPRYEWVKADDSGASKTKAGTEGPTSKDEPLLKPGELTERLNLKMQLAVDQLVAGNLKFEKLEADTQLAKGHLRGQVSVGQIFEGQAQLSAWDVPLLEVHPIVSGTATWKQIAIESALAYAQPESRDLASGRTQGQLEFAVQPLGATDTAPKASLMSTAQAKGQVAAEPVTLNSVKLGELVNNLTKQVPMLKIAPMKVSPMKGFLRAQIALAAQVVDVESFTAHDEGGSDLNLKGKVLLKDKRTEGDLVGTLELANPPVKGCLLEGNADAQGRLTLPLEIKGDLMHPGMNILSDMGAKLGSKALACEGRKLLDKVQKDGGKNLQQDLQQGLQDLFGH